jgi:hypothetical protein
MININVDINSFYIGIEMTVTKYLVIDMVISSKYIERLISQY